MRTVLHIGMPKTGTNALQRSLHASPAALAARGVLYPRSPDARHFNQKIILAELFDWRGSRTARLAPDQRPPSRAETGRRFFEDLRGAVQARPPRCLVLSTESLFRVLPENAPERFATAFEGVFEGLMQDVTVAAYLRRPSEHYLSRLQQQLKASHQAPRPGPPKHRRILEQYAAIFGEAALSPNLFHRPALAEGDIVADFAAKYLAPYGVTRADLATPERTNDTVSAESVDILRRYRLAFYPDDNDRFFPDSTRLVEALHAADAAAGAPRPRLRPGIAERADYAGDDPLWLRDRHGIVFPEFDYRRLEAGRGAKPKRKGELALEDILEIDRGRERAVLAELRTSPWTKKWDRRAWIDGLLADLA